MTLLSYIEQDTGEEVTVDVKDGVVFVKGDGSDIMFTVCLDDDKLLVSSGSPVCHHKGSLYEKEIQAAYTTSDSVTIRREKFE